MKSVQHGRWHWWLAPVVAGAAAVLWMLWPDASSVVAAGGASAAAALSPGGAAPTPSRPASSASSASSSRSPFSAAGLQVRQEQRAQWQLRLERAQGALQAYRESTRYPHDSQPASAHADQMQPNRPIDEEHVFRTADGKVVNGVRLLTTQERVFVQGSETVRFTVALRDTADKPQPLRIVRAVAREIPAPRTAATYPDLPLNVNDEGSGGDLLAGDGIYSVQLQPATQGFGGLLGQIRVEVFLQYRDQQTMTYFDILYTPESPATWAGGVQDGLEDGSLVFTLKASVKQAGRYVVTGRVDDASGKPFALVSFNDEVGVGTQTFRLVVFGKLVRDMKPVFPLTLRDVDGFLLRADAFPDRALMPRLPGKVHVSQSYALSSFSDSEWTSEERDRYLGELNHDVSDAQNKVEQLGKGP